jgi:hypothetical protein
LLGAWDISGKVNIADTCALVCTELRRSIGTDLGNWSITILAGEAFVGVSIPSSSGDEDKEEND